MSNQKIIFNTLEQLSHEELTEAVIEAAKKKNKQLTKVEDKMYVNFRWGEPIDNIFATVDIVDSVEDIDDL